MVYDIGAGMHSGIATQDVAWTALTTYERLTESIRGYVRRATASKFRHQLCVYGQFHSVTGASAQVPTVSSLNANRGNSNANDIYSYSR